MPDLCVKSHVARDLLQTALAFGDVPKAVWEYVANGLEYVSPRVNAKVRVVVNSSYPRRIEVFDNGRGMDWVGLQNFFTMHGENVDRRAGRSGRGRFGTGKCAAFGIAKCLRVITVQGKKLSCVELRRQDIEKIESGEEIPVKILKCEEQTDELDGTVITIDQITPPVDAQKIIWFIERHLTHWARNATVHVGEHLCQPRQPEARITQSFRPPKDLEDALGDVELTVKAALGLDDFTRGIAIYSRGVWHATYCPEACERLIFGEVDVPRLETDRSIPSPFDATRSLSLNPNNKLVQSLYKFIDIGVKAVREKWETERKKRLASDEQRRLVEHARQIASVINRDFKVARGRLPRSAAKSMGGGDYGMRPGPESELGPALIPGDLLPAENVIPPVPVARNSPQPERDSATTAEPKEIPGVLTPSENAGLSAAEAECSDRRTRSNGGFSVRYEHLGEQAERSKYQSDERGILINLDHPQLTAVTRAASVDSAGFRRFATEIAITEYALALTSERAGQTGNYVDVSDSLLDIRDTLDRVTRAAADLYRS